MTRVAVLASLSAPLPYGHTPHRAGRSSRRRLETPRCSVLTVAALATAQAQLALSMERSEHLKLRDGEVAYSRCPPHHGHARLVLVLEPTYSQVGLVDQ